MCRLHRVLQRLTWLIAGDEFQGTSQVTETVEDKLGLHTSGLSGNQPHTQSTSKPNSCFTAAAADSGEEERIVTPGPSTGAVVGGIFGALVLIAIIVGFILFLRRCQDNAEGPPKHKPPPPVKAGSSTEMLNKPSEPPTATETVPLSPGEVYYEPTGREPVTNLDDETTGALNGGAPPVLGDAAKYDNINELKDRPADGHHGNDLDSSNHEPPASSISRGESFVSPAMYV